MTHADYRICLKCRNEFPSHGPGNRICPKCQKKNSELRTINLPQIPPMPQVPGINVKDTD